MGLVVMLALLAGACSRSAGGGGAVGELVALGGVVQLLRGGDTVTVDGEMALSLGDEVLTDDGRARIALPGDQGVELAPGSRLRMGEGGVPHLVSGSALVTAGEGLVVRAREDMVEARDAVFRLSGDYNTSVGVYRGAATVVDAGAEVPALRELEVVAGDIVPRGPRPLTVRPNDPWDARLLGSAIDVGLGIQRLERGLAGQLRTAQGREAVAQVLRGDFSRSALQELLRGADPATYAEIVVAGQMALRAAKLHGSSPVAALESILQLRGEGAQWIVVVAEWQLLGASLLNALATLTGVIARALSPADTPSSISPTTPGSGPTTSPTTPGGSGEPSPGGDPNDPGDKPKEDPKEDPDPPPCSGTVECVVEGLLKGTTGL
ncbi:MAG: hypothetical protein ACRDHV_01470 [Actinomycetota bacterium]